MQGLSFISHWNFPSLARAREGEGANFSASFKRRLRLRSGRGWAGVNTHGHRHEYKDLQVTPVSVEPVNEEATPFDLEVYQKIEHKSLTEKDTEKSPIGDFLSIKL
jgi:hypothetical protein